ncbi:hypothetical protein [Tenacibaculum jejuense]|uniref:Uncharacterized protein n=1 Tax=Tenacibaculum jejuense TaxID=584609 RepID=A0A238U8E0_9FLAO|nr:hypothetical protein [Tenacibaculum jejuense]SNR15427.1 protein of unknown function [Tenacibaculum jejuense]
MKKSILNLGKSLTREDQKQILGGRLRDPDESPGGNPCGFMTCMNKFGRCAMCSFDEWHANEWGYNTNHH